METRSVTNLLLAIIAGVLLFGREAALAGVQGLIIGALGIGAIYLLFSIAASLLRSAFEAFRGAEGISGKAALFGSMLLAVIGGIFYLYAGLLWMNGDPRPLGTALSSNIGQIFIFFAMFGLFGYFAFRAYQRLRADPKAVSRFVARLPRYFGIWLIAPIYFGLREYREARFEGSGRFASAYAATAAACVGFLLWSALLPLGVLIGYGLAQIVYLLRSL